MTMMMMKCLRSDLQGVCLGRILASFGWMGKVKIARTAVGDRSYNLIADITIKLLDLTYSSPASRVPCVEIINSLVKFVRLLR